MAKVFTPGKTEKFTTENGIRDSNKATEYGKAQTTIRISESGRTQKLMAMEFTLGLTEIATKDSGTTVLSTAQALILLQTEKLTLVSLFKEKPTEKENILGRMELFTSEIL